MRASFLTKKDDTLAATFDVRAKLALCLMGSIGAIVFSSPLSLALLALVSTSFALAAARLSTVLKGWLFGAVMMAFALGCSALLGLAIPGLVRWNFISLSVPFLRMLVSLNLLLMLALSSPVQMLFSRLQAMRLPGWLHIPLSVAIRFIPTFLGDCAQIRDAARLRPGKGLSGLWRGFVVPLVFRMLYSTDDLAMAAELKGIGSAGQRTREEAPRLARRDYAVLAFFLLAITAAVFLQKFGPSFTPTPM